MLYLEIAICLSYFLLFSVINGVRVCYKTVDIVNSDSQSYVNIE